MRRLLITLLFSLFTISVFAQEQDTINTGFGFGFHLNQFQRDFGMGINVTSPFFADDKLAFRVQGNILWLQHPDPEGISTWTDYNNITFGLVTVSGVIKNFVRLYSEGGLLLLFPSEDFSSEKIELGGYGFFGFEFFTDKRSNYFLEIGGMGTSAIADKIPTEPIYSNGLSVSAGIRYYIK